jgi:hypothetical protein
VISSNGRAIMYIDYPFMPFQKIDNTGFRVSGVLLVRPTLAPACLRLALLKISAEGFIWKSDGNGAVECELPNGY